MDKGKDECDRTALVVKALLSGLGKLSKIA